MAEAIDRASVGKAPAPKVIRRPLSRHERRQRAREVKKLAARTVAKEAMA